MRRSRLRRALGPPDAIVALAIGLLFGVLAIAVALGWLSAGASAPAASSPGHPHRDVAFRPSRVERSVVRNIDAIRVAVDRGDASALCTPGRLATQAVVRALDEEPRGCEGAVGARLLSLRGELGIAARSVTLRPDLAVAQVTVSSGRDRSATRMAFLKNGRRWLLTFSDTGSPVPAPAERPADRERRARRSPGPDRSRAGQGRHP